MKMIERVARALFNVEQERFKLYHSYTNKILYGKDEITWEEICDVTIVIPMVKQQYLDQAKAAIAAMREPSEEMLTFSSFKSADDLYRYQAAIDAALKEE